MADTSFIKTIVEKKMVDFVSKMVGQPLEKRSLIVGKDGHGRPVKYELDGVSVDGKIGVFASASASGKIGQIRKLFMEVVILNSLNLSRRVMVMLSADVWTAFKNHSDGLVDLSKIEVVFCELDSDSTDQLDRVLSVARAEVGDKGKVKKVRGPRK